MGMGRNGSASMPASVKEFKAGTLEAGLSLFRWQNFLNADLVDQMISSCSFFLIGQVRADAVEHHHHQGTVIHIQPVRSADKLVGAISDKSTLRATARPFSPMPASSAPRASSPSIGSPRAGPSKAWLKIKNP
jgi:hypothetical protein